MALRVVQAGMTSGGLHERHAIHTLNTFNISCHCWNLMLSIFQNWNMQVCVPLYGIIHRWVLEGKLDDPYNEFFVVQCPAAAAPAASTTARLVAPLAGVGSGTTALSPSRDLWRYRYRLDKDRLPPFIGPSLAQRILRAGKAIHYLNLECGDGSWVQQRAETWAREPPAATAASAVGGSGAVREWLVAYRVLIQMVRES